MTNIIVPTIYDEEWNVLENPDLEKGATHRTERRVIHVYVVDVPEETHEEVIEYYPETGGKLVDIVVDVPEKGHWETYDEMGNIIEHFNHDLLDGAPHDMPIEGFEDVEVYIPFTPAELEENERKREEAESEQLKQQENDQLLDDMPELLCAMYEQNLQLQDTVDQQEDVLCAMYETMIGGE